MSEPQRRPKGSGALFAFTDKNGNQRWRSRRVLPASVQKTLRRKVATGEGRTPEEALLRQAANYQKAISSRGEVQEVKKPTEPRIPVARKPREKPKPDWYLSEFLYWWSSRRTVLPKVELKERRIIERYVLPDLGHLELRALTPKKISLWWSDFLASDVATTVPRNVYRTFNILLNSAVKSFAIPVNPLTTIDRPKIKTRIPEEEMLQMIDTTRGLMRWLGENTTDEDGDIRKRWMVEIDQSYYLRIWLALQGLRPAEALGLTIDKLIRITDTGTPAMVISAVLDRDTKGHPEIRDFTKTRESRIVPLYKQTHFLIEGWMTARDYLSEQSTWNPRPGLEDVLIVNDEGKHIDPNDDQILFQSLLARYQASKGIKNPTIFSIGKLRAISTTIQLDSGANPSLTARAWGHSLQTQQKYYYYGQVREIAKEITKGEAGFGLSDLPKGYV